jgi:hypothetical protein
MEYDDCNECWEFEFEDLKGRILKSVVQEDDLMVFTDSEDSVFHLKHRQACCERVYIESVVGDIADLIGTPILMAESVTNSREGDVPENHMQESWNYPDDGSDEFMTLIKPYSYTWTFFKLATIRGYVDIRFFGTSNGCYSESASLKCIMYRGKPNESW